MARVLLGVTGSVAAIRTPELCRGLIAAGHEVRVAPTEASLHFFDVAILGSVEVFQDRDEWPDGGYRRGDPVLHIELRKWAEVLVVAPLDAHTLAKLAYGLADNLLSCVLRAWDFSKPLVLAPAMNSLMWESPITGRHFRQLLEDRGDGDEPADWTLDDLGAVFARHCPGVVVVSPQSKRLACGDVGVGGMAEVGEIVGALK